MVQFDAVDALANVQPKPQHVVTVGAERNVSLSNIDGDTGSARLARVLVRL
ncbi:hypothetical protein JYU07_00850 [Roseiflexus sp. AH-315-K22]|nr:hypothetical protein [Roseiflexus sp. AH-315-K22]